MESRMSSCDFAGDITDTTKSFDVETLRKLKKAFVNVDAITTETENGAPYINIRAPDGRLLTHKLSPHTVMGAWEWCVSSLASPRDLDCPIKLAFYKFLNHFDYYVELEVHIWAQPSMERWSLEKYGVRCAKAVPAILHNKKMFKKTGEIYTHLWPNAIMKKSTSGGDDDDDDTTRYLIGVKYSPEEEHPGIFKHHYGGDIASSVREKLPNRPFLGVFVNVDVLARRDKPLLRDNIGGGATTRPVQNSKLNSVERSPRFRSFNEVLDRLRHDPRHRGIEYDLGYEDRFDGIIWMPLDSWGKKATEDKDWIPEHRVRRIKRKGDGVVVWDREWRVDITHL
jgi:uncharacterized protein (UPF0248 family)